MDSKAMIRFQGIFTFFTSFSLSRYLQGQLESNSQPWNGEVSVLPLCYHYQLFGRKNGIKNTYDDTYNILINQKYIYDYKIYNGEKYSVDLTTWRNYERIIANTNWYIIYGIFYHIEWGKHKWINVETNSLLYGNKVFINTTDYRWPNIDFNLIYNKYGNDLVFLNTDFDLKQYSIFVEKTGLNIPYISVSTFSEMCCAIASCKLFIGGLSAPLTVAHAIHKDRIIGLLRSVHNEDTIRNSGLESIWNNVRYSV